MATRRRLTVGLGGVVVLSTLAVEPRLEFRLPAARCYRLIWPEGQTKMVEPMWLRARPEPGEAGDVEFGSRVVLQLRPGVAVHQFAVGTPLRLARVVAPNLFILQAPNAPAAVREAARLAQAAEVLACYPIVRRPADLCGPYGYRPNDAWFATQWPLENRDASGTPAGPSLNARAAWAWTRGAGVTVAVADTGVEVTHPELIRRAEGAPHFNFSTQLPDGTPPGRSATWAHGTEVAGLIAAQMNNRIGMVGVAPEAALASWVIFAAHRGLVDDEALMDAYQFQSDTVAVQNHSWAHEGLLQNVPTLLEQIGLSNAWVWGRQGRGVVMVRAAGNDRERGGNANDDGYPADPHVIAVGAVRTDGRVASYSEPGACVLVSAPSGDTGYPTLFTTDLTGTNGVNAIQYLPPNTNMNDYAFNLYGFSGTSASAPLVSGVVALLLSVNPRLTIRDVQQILVLAARHFDLADPDLAVNGAGLLVSHNQGFGVPDAGQAIRLASNWPLSPEPVRVTLSQSTPTEIPDGALRVWITGEDVPPHLESLVCLPGTGPFPDTPTPVLPLVGVGRALPAVTNDLTGKAALIQRFGDNFAQPIVNAARAGAVLAILYNTTNGTTSCAGNETLCPLLRTDFTPIPAVFIRRSDGEALATRLGAGRLTLAQARLDSANFVFTVTNTLRCGHVSARLQTDHTLRGDLRITLVSPAGTRSILQRLNQDTNAGPTDWTYHSTHHFFESSAGVWTLSVGDQFPGGTGRVWSASLTLTGVAISDADADGLDDEWEQARFGSLAPRPTDDSDADGSTNLREYLLGTDPRSADATLRTDVSQWNAHFVRLSWSGPTNREYEVWTAPTPDSPFMLHTNLSGRWPETEWFTPHTNLGQRLFQVRSTLQP